MLQKKYHIIESWTLVRYRFDQCRVIFLFIKSQFFNKYAKIAKEKKINCTKKILSGHSFSQKCERQFHNTLHICDFRGSGDFRGFMTILVLANLWKLCTRPAPSLHYSINSVPAPPRPLTGREILSPPRPRNSGESRDKPQNSPRPICSPPPRPVPEFRGGGRGSPGIEALITQLNP